MKTFKTDGKKKNDLLIFVPFYYKYRKGLKISSKKVSTLVRDYHKGKSFWVFVKQTEKEGYLKLPFVTVLFFFEYAFDKTLTVLNLKYHKSHSEALTRNLNGISCDFKVINNY